MVIPVVEALARNVFVPAPEKRRRASALLAVVMVPERDCGEEELKWMVAG